MKKIKAKTHKWAAKRMKVTKNKKVVAQKAGNNHLMTNKGKTCKSKPYGKPLAKQFAKKMRILLNK